MKNTLFLLFIASTFFSYSQNKDSQLKTIFKNYKSCTTTKVVTRQKAIEFVNHQQGRTDAKLPMNASFKIVTLELAKTEKVLFVLASENLYLIADISLLLDVEPAKPKPGDDDDEEEPKDGQTYNIVCCGRTFNCADGDSDCNCENLAPNCDGDKTELNQLFFEMLSY